VIIGVINDDIYYQRTQIARPLHISQQQQQKWLWRSLKVIGSGTLRWAAYYFQLMIYCKL